MNAKRLIVVLLLGWLLTLTGGTILSLEDDVPIGVEPSTTAGPYRTDDSIWMAPAGRAKTAFRAAANAGGPDQFGYTWDDSIPLDWLDATTGTDTGMSGASREQVVGPISLPFAFDYYSNRYGSLYIAASGYVAFTESPYWDSQLQGAPSPGRPNDVIAPYASLFGLADSTGPNRVYYRAGGAAPNRYFVVEWHQVVEDGGEATYTFEVVLHENGDIVFQYLAMGDVSYCGITGIEDSRGWDGLNYVPFCQEPPSNRAVRFSRPADSARVAAWPPHAGAFAAAGQEVAFRVGIENTGELGADTYEIDATGAAGWATALYAADGTTPLSDTNSNGHVDTGLLAQGQTIAITVKITAPPATPTGGHTATRVRFTSSLNAGRWSDVRIDVAAPARFAQTVSDQAQWWADDGRSGRELHLVQVAGQGVVPILPEDSWGSYWRWNAEASVVETPAGFATFWPDERGVAYAVQNRYGDTVRPVSKLTGGSPLGRPNPRFPAAAATPDGHIGVVWTETNDGNSNLFLAILDSSGRPIYGPANLTGNTQSGQWCVDAPFFGGRAGSDLGITATADNRFVMAWHQALPTGDDCYYDIVYSIRDSSGGVVRAATPLTNAAGEGTFSTRPAVTALSGNRALITYEGQGPAGDWDYGLWLAVLGSGGQLLKPASRSALGNGYDYDAAQLATGEVIVVVSTYNADERPVIDYAVFNGQTLEVAAGPYMLDDPASLGGMEEAAVTADQNGRAILTWKDADWSYRAYLHYALIGNTGALITPPMIYYTSRYENPFIESDNSGYHTTSYSWNPPEGVDGRVALNGALIGGQPGQVARVAVEAANLGQQPATGVTLTMTLNNGLAYVSDTLGIAPTVSGNVVKWNLPTMRLLERRAFQVAVRVPAGAALGEKFPALLTLASAGPEANPANNGISAQFFAARQVLIPTIAKP